MRRDQGSIYEHKAKPGKPRRSRPFEVRLTVNGNRRTIGYCATRAEARTVLRQAIRDRDDGKLMAGDSRTVAAYLKYWLETVKAPKLRGGKDGGSYNRYACRLGYIAKRIGDVQLHDLQAPAIRSCYAALADEDKLAPRTIRMTHGLLKGALEQAVKEDIILRNPCDLVDPPKAERYEAQILQVEWVRRIVTETTESPYHALWVFLLTTGVRIGEALALRWENVHGTTITIERTTVNLPGGGQAFGPPKTAKGMRSFDLAEATIRALEDHRTRQAFRQRDLERRGGTWHDNGLIFPNTTGGILQKGYVWRVWSDMLKELGIPHRRPHDARHTVATWLVENGTMMQAVQAHLGHADLSTTMGGYSHLTPHMRQGIGRQMDEMVTAPTEQKKSDAR